MHPTSLSAFACARARLGLTSLALVTALSACGASQVTPLPAPDAAPAAAPDTPAAKPAPARTVDAYRDFKGEHVAAGEVFRLKAKAKAIDGLEVVIRMVKVEWTTGELPDGRKIKEGTAELVIQKGAEERTTRVQQDDTKRSLGCQITVKAVGEDYDQKRFDYLPWVDLIVEAR